MLSETLKASQSNSDSTYVTVKLSSLRRALPLGQQYYADMKLCIVFSPLCLSFSNLFWLLEFTSLSTKLKHANSDSASCSYKMWRRELVQEFGPLWAEL